MSDMWKIGVVAIAATMFSAGCRNSTTIPVAVPTVQLEKRLSGKLQEVDYEILRSVIRYVAEENDSTTVVMDHETLSAPYLTGLEDEAGNLTLANRLSIDGRKLSALLKKTTAEIDKLQIDGIEVLHDEFADEVEEAVTRMWTATPVLSTEANAYVFLFEERGGNGGEHVLVLSRIQDAWVVTDDVILGIM